MGWDVVYKGGYMPEYEARLRRDYRVVDFADAAGGGTPVATGIARIGFSADDMDRLTGLQAICLLGTGTDGVDLAAARHRGIAVSHTPGTTAEAVAELAIALLLAAGRRLLPADRHVRERGWEREPFAVTRGLYGSTLGIVGLGAIGAAVARRATALGMRVGYCGPRPKPVEHAWFPTVLQLARAADHLVVSAPGGPETRHLVDRAVLRALGPDGILVNVSRGSVVDEQGLIDALEAGEIAGAGLDVFETEPLVPEALRQQDRALLSPHAAGRERTALEATYRLVRQNIDAALGGHPLVTPVPHA